MEAKKALSIAWDFNRALMKALEIGTDEELQSLVDGDNEQLREWAQWEIERRKQGQPPCDSTQ